MGKPRGLPKSGGRTAGTPNKIGKDLRPLLEAEVEALIPEINKIWNELSSVEKARFLLYITIEKYTIFQLKSIPVLIVCEDKKSYLNAG